MENWRLSTGIGIRISVSLHPRTRYGKSGAANNEPEAAHTLRPLGSFAPERVEAHLNLVAFPPARSTHYSFGGHNYEYAGAASHEPGFGKLDSRNRSHPSNVKSGRNRRGKQAHPPPADHDEHGHGGDRAGRNVAGRSLGDGGQRQTRRARHVSRQRAGLRPDLQAAPATAAARTLPAAVGSLTTKGTKEHQGIIVSDPL